jgi:hypothetical protein
VLVEDNVVHGFSKVGVHLVEKGGGVCRRLSTEGFGILSHAEDAVDFVAVNFRDLVLGHVFNVVVVLYQGVGIYTLLICGLEAAGEDTRVFFVEQDVDSWQAYLFSGVFPVAFVAFSAGKEPLDT